MKIVVLVLAISCMAGCSTVPNEPQAMNSRDFALMAANLANDESERLYDSRPFSRKDYVPELIDNRWYWGRMSAVGVGRSGLSAEVTVNANGTNPRVKVYSSTDQLLPPGF